MSAQVNYEVNERLKDPHNEAVVIIDDEIYDYPHNKNSVLCIPPSAPNQNQESKSNITI
jgi:hypothetical protein